MDLSITRKKKRLHYSCVFCKRGMDRLERRVSYNGGFSLHGYFFEFEWKELEVEGHARDSSFYTRTISGRS